MSRLPQRIVCLSTETVEVLYALGEADRIVGISGYTVIPPQARKEKPKVFAFSTGDLERILAVQPDLVLCFCDLQANIARDLVKAGIPVHVFNQRTVEDILAMIETVGRLVGAQDRAQALVGELEAVIDANLDDGDFFIKKAVGWALRQLGWFEPDYVERYVARHEKRLSALSRREALKSLEAARAKLIEAAASRRSRRCAS